MLLPHGFQNNCVTQCIATVYSWSEKSQCAVPKNLLTGCQEDALARKNIQQNFCLCHILVYERAYFYTYKRAYIHTCICMHTYIPGYIYTVLACLHACIVFCGGI